MVLKPWKNGQSIAGRKSDIWVIDFGVQLSLNECALFVKPFSQVETKVKPVRTGNNRDAYKKYW